MLFLQMCPHKRAFVLDHGIVGDDLDGNLYVSCQCYMFDVLLYWFSEASEFL
jgi:hypothetical protein